jgi:hypothetical protein
MKRNGYIIVNEKRRHIDGRIWKTHSKASKHIAGIIKNNSLEARNQVGYINLRLERYQLNLREIEEMEKAKDFIWR